MDNRQEIKDFLTTRRARISPDSAGITWRGARRVPGLRREEVAQLAGVSADYYTQIERGQVTGVSDEILHAIGRGLRLDDDEMRHLFSLVRSVQRRSTVRGRNPATPPTVPPTVRAMLTAMSSLPALIQTTCLDVVDANALGRALYTDLFTSDSLTRSNLASSSSSIHARLTYSSTGRSRPTMPWACCAWQRPGLRTRGARPR